MTFYFINPYKPLGYEYETCLQNLTNITDAHKTNIYTYKFDVILTVHHH